MIQIGKHKVGQGFPPFIIAEVGSNWRNFDDAKDAIAQAKACGADAVKFQAFTHHALYGMTQKSLLLRRDAVMNEAGFGSNSLLLERLPDDTDLESALPLSWLPKLKEKADACGIEFMCSAFSPELVEAVNPYVSAHKVASAELTHLRILQKLRQLGKPVILSTGASGEADIRGALEVLTGQQSKMGVGMPSVPVILMYCVASYPAQSIDLNVIPLMRSSFGLPVGYSDHSTDVLTIPVHACLFGEAVVLEKHVTFIDADTPDRPHSLTGDQFRAMVRRIRGDDVSRIGPSAEEEGMVKRHNRLVIATRNIAQGEALVEGHNMGIYRSLRDDVAAAHPFGIEQLAGRSAKRAIEAGEGISFQDV
jgi:sialic acid synthase SpsE